MADSADPGDSSSIDIEMDREDQVLNNGTLIEQYKRKILNIGSSPCLIFFSFGM